MTVTTQVVWAYGTPTIEGKRFLHQQIDILKNQGATDGNFTQSSATEGLVIHREWTTINDANNWINFVSDYNPVSAEIVSE